MNGTDAVGIRISIKTGTVQRNINTFDFFAPFFRLMLSNECHDKTHLLQEMKLFLGRVTSAAH